MSIFHRSILSTIDAKRYFVLFFLFGICQLVFVEALPHTELLIKFPTRGRPEKFFPVLDLYYTYLSGKISYQFVITCDKDDDSMNCSSVIERLKKYENLFFYFGDSKTKIEACNADLQNHGDFEVLLLASDDMIPRVVGYDAYILEDMRRYFPDSDGLLHYDEGHAKTRVATLPVIGKKFYDRFGYIYHPAYISFYCDNEMTEVAKILDVYVYIEHLLIEHVHPDYFPIEEDELYKRNNVFVGRDQGVFFARKERNFDLPDFLP